MKKATAITIRSNDPDVREILGHITTRDYLDTLEELLYIWWELRPVSRTWKAELVQTGVTTFCYISEEEPALVRWVGDLAYEVEM